MLRSFKGAILAKLLVLGFVAFVLAVTLLTSTRTRAQYGCSFDSYEYCDANFGMWVNPQDCTCAPYCSLTDADCTERGGTLDYANCRCNPNLLTVFEPCNDYNASIYCGGNRFDEAFSGITWVYGNGNCNPEWETRCALLGGSFNYNSCTCDLGPAYIPPTASPTPPSLERCPIGSPAQQACAGSRPPPAPSPTFNTTNCTCKWGP